MFGVSYTIKYLMEYKTMSTTAAKIKFPNEFLNAIWTTQRAQGPCISPIYS